MLEIRGVRDGLRPRNPIEVINKTRNETYAVSHSLEARQIEIIRKGSLVNLVREES